MFRDMKRNKKDIRADILTEQCGGISGTKKHPAGE